MKKTICIFEDENYVNFLPLVYTRPVYDLRCGILTLREKISSFFPSFNLVLHSRNYLSKCLRERNPKININRFDGTDILYINGRLLIDKSVFAEINKLKSGSALFDSSGFVIAANISAKNISSLADDSSGYLSFGSLNNLARIESGVKLKQYPWELVNENGAEIANDFTRIMKSAPKSKGRIFVSVEFKNKKNIFIGSQTIIDPFVYMDASNGPIYIGNDVHIMSHSYIQGPVSIGNNSIIKSGSSVYHNTSIGEYCKVGGEVDSSIIQSYSNKQHEGFLGHSYLGSWINIGAATNNSDLKNNYENISVLLNGKPVDTGSQFAGLIMGDHSKTAIGTLFNTGTIVGVSCNIFGAGFPPRYIPSFAWGGSDFIKQYDIKKALQAARIVLTRREKELTPNEEELLKTVFELTSDERARKTK